jgi:PAS domain S-box-containing protein
MVTAQDPDNQDPMTSQRQAESSMARATPPSLWSRLRSAIGALIALFRGGHGADARYQRLFDGVPIALYVSAPDGRILDVNPAMVQLLGHPDKESLLRQNAFDAFVSRADRQSQMEMVEREQVVRDYEVQLRRGDGEVIWVVDQVRAVRGSDGRVLYYQGSLKDITERKRAERELREAKEKLQAIIQASPLAIVAIDRKGRVLSWNAAAERIFGWREHEVLGRPLPIVQPEARPEFAALRERVLRGERLQGVEIERRHRDGRTLHVNVSAGPIYDANGEIVGIIAVVMDITERKELDEHRRHLAQILEATPDLVAIATVEGQGIYLNPAGRRMLGVPDSEDLAGRPIWECAAEPFRSLIRDTAFPEAARSGMWSGEVAFKARDGRDIPTSLVMIAHAIESGAVDHMSVIARDLTDRKALESRLREAQTMEAIGRLAGGIAHDFNNLLTSIIGHSDLLLRQVSSEESRADVQEIKVAGQRAATLTSQLLAFSRRQMVQPRLLDLNSVIADLGSQLAGMTGPQVELATILDATMEPVRADPVQIEEVILSLVENACEAMPRGGRLTLETGLVDLPREIASQFGIAEAGRYAVLAVSDTGCGMDEETQGRIFEPFFSTKPDMKGTGLGLATVYGIVHQAGGHVRVDSRPSCGTSMRVYLPVAEPRAIVPAIPERVNAGQQPARGTVLLAEDEPAVLSLAARVLRSAGYRVLEARDGAEAIEIQGAHREPIDLLVTDVVMPRLGGPDLAERLLAARPGTAVVYMSGYTDNAAVRELMADENTLFLQKPFSPAALLEATERSVSGGR